MLSPLMLSYFISSPAYAVDYFAAYLYLSRSYAFRRYSRCLFSAADYFLSDADGRCRLMLFAATR